MLKTKDVQLAFRLAVLNTKRTKRMADMKYPLLEKKGYKFLFYFTDATGVYYDNILGQIVRRKKNTIVKAPYLYCFEYDHKRDGWFIDDVPELTDRIEDLFDDYFTQYVEPNLLKTRGER